ncbi:MAG TPA: hypothetical protein VGC15_00345 [Acetobacteraceae bacterium]
MLDVMRLAAAWLGMTMLAATGPCTEGSEFEPPLCPTGLPPVASLRIELQGAAVWTDPGGASCRQFQLSGQQVRRFFQDARRVDAAAVHHTLPESPCSVLGRVVFADGSAGSWRLDQFELCWLDRVGSNQMVLYCRSCRLRPWAQ